VAAARILQVNFGYYPRDNSKTEISKMKALKYSLLATVLVFKGLNMGFAQDVDPQVIEKIHTIMTGMDDAYGSAGVSPLSDLCDLLFKMFFDVSCLKAFLAAAPFASDTVERGRIFS